MDKRFDVGAFVRKLMDTPLIQLTGRRPQTPPFEVRYPDTVNIRKYAGDTTLENMALHLNNKTHCDVEILTNPHFCAFKLHKSILRTHSVTFTKLLEPGAPGEDSPPGLRLTGIHPVQMFWAMRWMYFSEIPTLEEFVGTDVCFYQLFDMAFIFEMKRYKLQLLNLLAKHHRELARSEHKEGKKGYDLAYEIFRCTSDQERTEFPWFQYLREVVVDEGFKEMLRQWDIIDLLDVFWKEVELSGPDIEGAKGWEEAQERLRMSRYMPKEPWKFLESP
ncbi:hypothetical protein ABW19_dt0204252 [Dactylella cylindrospora]|nr:hypothetical protein ABW19_dt0204252 [Dactylella cylindrospora]